MNQKHKNLTLFLVSLLIYILFIFLCVKITKIEALKWLYFGVFCIIDHYFFYFINWTPWKKRKERKKQKKTPLREWCESVIFAIIAATLIYACIITRRPLQFASVFFVYNRNPGHSKKTPTKSQKDGKTE